MRIQKTEWLYRRVETEIANTEADYSSPFILGGWSVLFIKISKGTALLAAGR